MSGVFLIGAYLGYAGLKFVGCCAGGVVWYLVGLGILWSFVLDLPALVGAAWFVASIC